MRPVLPGDISAAARALLPLPPSSRKSVALRLIKEAQAADRYRKKFRKAHALFGNGTLMAAAMMRPLAREPRLDDPDYLDCRFHVFQALMDQRRPLS